MNDAALNEVRPQANLPIYDLSNQPEVLAQLTPSPEILPQQFPEVVPPGGISQLAATDKGTYIGLGNNAVLHFRTVNFRGRPVAALVDLEARKRAEEGEKCQFICYLDEVPIRTDFTIGNTRTNCATRVDDPSVNDRHATIYHTENGWFIENTMGGENGVRLGEMQAKKEVLEQHRTARRDVGLTTDVGLVRELDEDAIHSSVRYEEAQGRSSRVAFHFLADGMGGHDHGEVASQTAVAAMVKAQNDFSANDARFNPKDWLVQAVENANTAVHKAGDDMGTTLEAAVIIGTKVYGAHVGDSRAYDIGPENIEPLTTDHSLVQRLLDLGQITPGEAAVHPQKNVIYRTLGDKNNVEVDTYEVELAAGHSFLVCCDGLWGLVKDEEIREIVNHAVSAQTACDQLVALAKERGGDDNISLILDKPERTDSVAVPDSLAVRASQGVEQWSDDRLKKVIATILLTPKPAEPQKIMLSALVLEAQKRKAEGRGLEALTADLLVQTFEYLFDHHISLI